MNHFRAVLGIVALMVAAVWTGSSSAQMKPPDPKIMIGHEATDFTLSTLNGEKVKLSDLKGKIVVLDFWATWCRPCRMSLPDVIEVTNEYKDKDVVLYTVNLGDPIENVKKFVELTGFKMQVLLDVDGSAARDYLVSNIPQTVIVGKDGIVKVVRTGMAPKTTLKKELEALVSDGKPSEPKKDAEPRKKAEPKKAEAMKQIGIAPSS